MCVGQGVKAVATQCGISDDTRDRAARIRAIIDGQLFGLVELELHDSGATATYLDGTTRNITEAAIESTARDYNL